MDLGLGPDWMERYTLREMDAVGLRRYERFREEMEMHDDFGARTAAVWAGKRYTDLRILSRNQDRDTGGDPHEGDISWDAIRSIGPFSRARREGEVN